jgi:hypothetical protein
MTIDEETSSENEVRRGAASRSTVCRAARRRQRRWMLRRPRRTPSRLRSVASRSSSNSGVLSVSPKTRRHRASRLQRRPVQPDNETPRPLVRGRASRRPPAAGSTLPSSSTRASTAFPTGLRLIRASTTAHCRATWSPRSPSCAQTSTGSHQRRPISSPTTATGRRTRASRRSTPARIAQPTWREYAALTAEEIKQLQVLLARGHDVCVCRSAELLLDLRAP